MVISNDKRSQSKSAKQRAKEDGEGKAKKKNELKRFEYCGP